MYAWRGMKGKIADKFYDLVRWGLLRLCLERRGEREKKTKKQKPELLNINQDDNKMEKMYEKYFSNNA